MSENECEGSCIEHSGKAIRVRVSGGEFLKNDSMHFYYCAKAIREDVLNGFKVEVVDEEKLMTPSGFNK